MTAFTDDISVKCRQKTLYIYLIYTRSVFKIHVSHHLGVIMKERMLVTEIFSLPNYLLEGMSQFL